MGATASRDGDTIPSVHPLRLSRLGTRPSLDVPRPLLDEAALRERLHETPLLPPHPHDVPFVHYRSPVQRSAIVANVVNLDKTTLSVAPSAEDPRVLLLQFDFSASVPGYIAVYYGARQIVHRRAATDGAAAPVRRVSYVPRAAKYAEEDAPVSDAESHRAVEKTKFKAGLALRYQQKSARGLRLDDFDEAHLVDKVDDHYPVVIRIEARHPSNSTVPRRSRVVSQSTFAVLTRKRGDGEWGIKVVRQEVLVAGTIYVLQELYGIGAVDVTASRSPAASADSDSGKNVFSVDASNECVICLTEPCNTAVLPCNHLCLCQDCGAKLSTDPSQDRRRCPICRTDLESLLRIVPTSLTTDKKKDGKVPATEATVVVKANGQNAVVNAAEVLIGEHTRNESTPMEVSDEANGGNNMEVTNAEAGQVESGEGMDVEDMARSAEEDVANETDTGGRIGDGMTDESRMNESGTNDGRTNDGETNEPSSTACPPSTGTTGGDPTNNGELNEDVATGATSANLDSAVDEQRRTEKVVDEGEESSDSVKSTAVQGRGTKSGEAERGREVAVRMECAVECGESGDSTSMSSDISEVTSREGDGAVTQLSVETHEKPGESVNAGSVASGMAVRAAGPSTSVGGT